LPDLGPCDFTVSQIENKTEGKMFWNSVASGTQENYFHGAFEAWKKQ
jgi:hypothetical protein